MANQDWQSLEDAYLTNLNRQLNAGTLPLKAVGVWNWPAYGLTEVSAVVVGSRQLQQPTAAIQLVYFVTIYSKQPIPNPGQATRETGTAGAYSFVQLGASVGADPYQTTFLSTYVGTNPYPQAATPTKAAAAAGAVPLDDGTGPTSPPPHPPP